MNLLTYRPAVEQKLSVAFPRDGIQVVALGYDTSTGDIYVCFRLDPRAKERA